MGGAETGVGPFESMSFKGPHRPVRRHRPTVRPVWSRQPRQRLTKRVAPPAGPSVPFWPRSPLRECVGHFYAPRSPARQGTLGPSATKFSRHRRVVHRSVLGVHKQGSVLHRMWLDLWTKRPPCGRARRVRIRSAHVRPRSRPPARRPHGAARAHPPRRHLRRRLRVAARQGVTGDAGLPRGGERLDRGPDRAPGRPAGGHLRGDQGTHPGDRPVGAHPDRRPLVLRPLDRGEAVRRQLPLPRRRPGRLDPAAALPRRGRARRGGAARRQRARRGSRLLLPRDGRRSAPTAGCWRSAPTPSATSASCSRSRT